MSAFPCSRRWRSSLSSLVAKFVSKHHIDNPWSLLFYSELTFIPFLLLLPCLFPVVLPQRGWPYIVCYSAAFFVGQALFIKAIYQVDASTFAPFYQLQAAFIAVLASVFLGERLSFLKYVCILLMVAGAVVVTFDERLNIRSFLRLATILIVGQQFFHAISNLFAGFALRAMNSFTFLFWGDLTVSLLAISAAPLVGLKHFKVSASQIKPLFVSGLFSVTGAALLFTAFETNVTVTSALALLTAPMVLLLTCLSSTFRPELLEHHSPPIYALRAAGLALILVGALGLSR